MSSLSPDKVASVAEIVAEKVLASPTVPDRKIREIDETQAKEKRSPSQGQSSSDEATAAPAVGESKEQREQRPRGSFRDRAGLSSPPFKCNFELTADAVEVAKLEETAEKIQQQVREQQRDRPGYYAARRPSRTASSASVDANRVRTTSTGSKSATGETVTKSPPPPRQWDRPGFFAARNGTTRAPRQPRQQNAGNYAIDASHQQQQQDGGKRRNQRRRAKQNAIIVPVKVVVG